MPKRSTASAKRPAKPHPDFPLFAHQSGQWCKKIKGKPRYFGSWRTDLAGVAALEAYTRDLPYLLRGEIPPAIDISNGCTIEQLCNEFMESKAAAVKDGDLSPRTLHDYHTTVKAIAKHFGNGRVVVGLTQGDFREFRTILANRMNINSLKSTINKIRVVFNFGHTASLYPEPINFGNEFKRPSAKRQRRARNESGPRLFSRDEIHRLIDIANVHLTAMIHLGCNAGFGNSDCASLPFSAVDMEKGWISFPRPKTEISRRVPLWPETISALKASIARRPAPAAEDFQHLVFLTKNGVPWVRMTPAREDDDGNKTPGIPLDYVSAEFSKLAKKLGIKRNRLSFYTLRHCFETYAGESRDQVAVDAVMGHADVSMAANYRHRISDERLQDVVNVMRGWLWPDEQAKGELV